MLSLDTLSPSSFVDQERDRLQAHFEWVIAVLRAQPTGHLDGGALAARERMIGALEFYRDRGVFPRNPLHDRMVPTFVDHGGRECAVAHLMQTTGDDDFVARIHDRLNLEHVAAMVGPELDAWAERAGLSVYEVAFIQPDYCTGPEPPCTSLVSENCNPNGGAPIGCPCHLDPWPDGSSCSVDFDFCRPGKCQSGTCIADEGGRDCDDGDPATADTCDPSDGCVSAAIALPGGQPGGEADDGSSSETGTSNDPQAAGCAHRDLPDGSIAPLLAAVFLLGAMRRRPGVHRQ